MTTAFVLSGGGSLGAVQVGMLSALHDHGIRPDLLVGTSAGALNAGYLGTHGFTKETVESLGKLWRNTRRSNVFPFDPLRQLLAVGGRRRSLCSSAPLHRVISSNLPASTFDALQIPVHVVTTDTMSGEELLLSSGDLHSAVLASAAIPGIFEPVEREGRFLMDGGVSNNIAISQAVTLGAERVIVLPAGYACALATPPQTPIAAALHALTVLIEQRLIVEIAALRDRVEIVVLPPLCPLSISPADFSAAQSLMVRAHVSSNEWLDAGNHLAPRPERVLSLHTHAGQPAHHQSGHGADDPSAAPIDEETP